MAVTVRIRLKNGNTWGVSHGVFRGEGCVCIPIDQIEGMSAEDIGETALSLVPEVCCAKAHETATHCDPDYIHHGPTDVLKEWRDILDPYKEHASEIMQAWINVSAELNSRARNLVKHKRRSKTGRAKRPGYVYLIQSDSFYKIGRTKTVDKRLEQLSTQPPFDVELLHTIATDDMGTLESKLHARFSDKRKNGEWFELAPEDVEYIKGL